MKGCSNTPLDKWDTAEVLWESKGTEEATSVGDIITITPDVNSQIITVNAKKNGNAVVAVKKDGKILWSWHIWACEGYNPDATAQKYNNNAGVVMDRNLGATSATPGKPQTIGLLYQWDRKDPFLSGGKELRSQSFSAFMWIGTSVTPCSGGARSFACNVRCVKIAVK